MIFRQAGITLMEIVVVVIIIGAALALSFPNFLPSIEQAKASNARNNLLAIYSAEQNYNNNNGGSYCLDVAATGSASCQASDPDTNCAHSLADINCNLSLNIQDDGTYTYSCSGSTCTATRASIASSNTIVLTLNAVTNIRGSGTMNPVCNLTSAWCPN